MNNNASLALYPRITHWSAEDRCCGEWKALCPDCGTAICVFCEIECMECEAPLF